jgi:ribosomal protein S12 methylthiotransferase
VPAPEPDAPAPAARRVALVTLGCVRNEVDSSELGGRLAAAGWELVGDAAEADVAVVNTCGFVEQAKKESVDVLLEAADLRDDAATRTRAVVAVGCLAERYGRDLADQLPEADAVLGFDDYAGLAGHLDAVLGGHRPVAHVPRDRRTLLPVAPAARARARTAPAAEADPLPPTARPASGPRAVRRVLDGRPWAPLKLAEGCDRRCAFCAIPMFRGAFTSRPPLDVLAEARWLADQGVREVLLVSENTTSYGKDLGDLRLLEQLLPQVAGVEGLLRVRASYLQPAEIRPGLLDALLTTPGVCAYADVSFQHAAPGLLRRMRRFGGTEAFLGLVEQIRARAPHAGIRSNVIVGFPGETEDDVAELERFLTGARLDVVGVFGYSDEDGTEAAGLDGHLDAAEVAARADHVGRLVEELVAQRAEDRVGEVVDVLVEEQDEDGAAVGRAEHQGPDVDGTTTLTAPSPVGALVRARVVASRGADLVAAPLEPDATARRQALAGARA